jgi:hypothetical protein
VRNLQIETFAFSRRAFLASGMVLFTGRAVSFAASSDDPVAVIRAIYRRAVKGDGPNWSEKADRPKDLSKSLIALWAKTDAKLVAGDVGPVDFDVIADTNGLTLTGFSLASEKQDGETATIAATLVYKEGNPRPEPSVVRYDLVREGGRWRIDEIRGGHWSVRKMLARFLEE